MAESGVPGFDVVGWWGFAAPAGTPAAVVARLNREINQVLASPALRSAMRAEIETWGKVITKGKVQVE